MLHQRKGQLYKQEKRCRGSLCEEMFVRNSPMTLRCKAAIQEMRKCCVRYPSGRTVFCSGLESEEKEEQKSTSGGGALE
uniref:Cx9C motif-containing protein 4 n=1 Tax=Anolis carolinensis TaxID=28377 RepID=H9G3Q9_ANOCA